MRWGSPSRPAAVVRACHALCVVTLLSGGVAVAQPGDPSGDSPAGQPAQAPATQAPPAGAPAADAPAPAEATPPVQDAPAAPAEPAEASPGAAPPADGPVMVAPRLRQFAEPTYPPQALAEGATGRVVLELLIAADGAISDITVAESAGHGFDEAALEAAPRLQFSAATRDGVGVAARIRFPYVFELRVADAPAPDPELPPPPAILEGTVRDEQGDTPLADARITVTPPEGDAIHVQTDAEGRYAVPDLPAGNYSIAVRARGFVERFDVERLRSGEATALVQRLQRLPDPDAFGAVARVPPPPREVTRRSIGRAQLTRIPGTRGDALRTVEIMPGVARPPFGAGALIIRGSSPRDSQVQLEGLQVPLLYHFGGLTSFFHSHLLESVEFFPGNFSVRYGRKRGGIVDVNVRDPATDGFHGQADINLIDSSVLVEGPISEDWSFAGAYRRSYFDIVFEALAPPEIGVVAAPVYFDYQAMAVYRPAARHRLRLMAFGTSDRFEILFQEPPSDETSEITDIDLFTGLHRLQLSWYATLTDDLQHDLELAVGTTEVRFSAGSFVSFSIEGTDLYTRSEWRQRITDKVRMIYGLDLLMFPGEVHFSGPQLGEEGSMGPGNDDGGPANRARQSVDLDFTTVTPALYVEADLNLDPVRVVLGSRVDYYNQIDEFSFDPRMSAHYQMLEGTSLKAGMGLFSQPPEPQEASEGIGNTKLDPTRTVHLGGGVDQQLTEAVFVGAELFYKHFYDLVVGTEGGQPPFFINDGEGRAYGLEIAARVEPTGRFFGYLSYTLSRSERKGDDGTYELFNFDQPHILTLSSVYRMGRGWEVGGTFRLVSGNPETPLVGSLQSLDTGAYSPLRGRTNSARAPLFNRLDIRIEKKWTFDAWKLALYLDIQNVYNANNIEGTQQDYAYRNEAPIIGLPFLPNLGIKGEL